MSINNIRIRIIMWQYDLVHLKENILSVCDRPYQTNKMEVLEGGAIWLNSAVCTRGTRNNITCLCHNTFEHSWITCWKPNSCSDIWNMAGNRTHLSKAVTILLGFDKSCCRILTKKGCSWCNHVWFWQELLENTNWLGAPYTSTFI